ncbi:amino acid ABC transporter substrate-binding protein [uncultured Sutterella sp.]|uniref:amino acid ABC transporter substrate-binding protein n=1 Tax=uncultured Sutterella sp. TaxID=286133 RepID=UPI0025E5047E|nr:amino acid ABC transporter substrate-binding protein [uncultured Sutterella sp.]
MTTQNLTRRTLVAAASAAAFAFSFAGAVHADTLDLVKASGELKIGTEGVYAPYTYHDDKGNLTGYDVEVARSIAAKLGVKPVFVETQWDGMIAGLDAKRFDIVVNQVTPTPERRAKYLFSVPYTYNKGALIVKKTNNEVKSFDFVKGRRAAQTLTSNWGKLADALGAEIVGAADFPSSVQLVATGRADLTINSELSTLDFLRIQPNAPVKIVALWKDPIEIAIPLRKSDAALQAAVNKALDELQADGTLSKLALQFLGTDASKK